MLSHFTPEYTAAAIGESRPPPLSIFEDAVVDFLDALSTSLLSERVARQYPDVLAFGLWCRRAELLRRRREYDDGSLYLGRGLVFHIAPANVPLMFAYSLAAGLLAGNANIVRLSSRTFPQVDDVCGRIDDLLLSPAHDRLADYVKCVRYDATESATTAAISGACDVRVIWGGDATIDRIRRIPLGSGAHELAFSNRRSIAIIDSHAWLRCERKASIIRGFHNDAFTTLQDSCSSPLLVVWLGDAAQEARQTFWSLLRELVEVDGPPTGADAVRALEYTLSLSATNPTTTVHPRRKHVATAWCDAFSPEELDAHPGGGVFVETRIDELREIEPLLGPRCQTVSCFGVPPGELATVLADIGAVGVCRVVPIGRTLDFELTWDGHDLIRSMSRKIEVRDR